MSRRTRAALALAAVLALPAAAGASDDGAPPPLDPAALEAAPADLTGRAIAARSEDVLRGDRTFIQARMTVVSPRLPSPRVVAFRAFDDRQGERTFIRILEPPKDAGTGFLKLDRNLWMYVPRVERTMRIPPSMMLQSWMGSDFTNDDLVRESSQLDDYDHVLLGVDAAPATAPGRRAFVVEYLPHEDAPVVWGRIVTWIDAETYTPLRQDFYDEDGVRLRVMRYGEVREADGRSYPHHWEMLPLDKEGHATRVEVEEIQFAPDFDDGVFTTRNLKRRD